MLRGIAVKNTRVVLNTRHFNALGHSRLFFIRICIHYFSLNYFLFYFFFCSQDIYACSLLPPLLHHYNFIHICIKTNEWSMRMKLCLFSYVCIYIKMGDIIFKCMYVVLKLVIFLFIF